MTRLDLPGVCELRRLAGWNQRPADWRRLLEFEPEGCFVATRHGAVVGSVTTTSYGQALAWIGMMLVHPEQRRQGIGLRLMNRALEYLHGRGIGCIRLDATPAGFPLYERLGFVSEWNLTRWQRPLKQGQVGEEMTAWKAIPPGEVIYSAQMTACKAVPPLPKVRRIQKADWKEIDVLDTMAFGTPRPRLLRSLAQDSREAVVCINDWFVSGWGLLRPGENADYLGPLACANIENVATLAAALVRAAEGRAVFWDIPDQNEPARTVAQRFGFTPLRPLIRMRLGPDSVRSDPQAQFGIADPAVG